MRLRASSSRRDCTTIAGSSNSSAAAAMGENSVGSSASATREWMFISSLSKPIDMCRYLSLYFSRLYSPARPSGATRPNPRCWPQRNPPEAPMTATLFRNLRLFDGLADILTEGVEVLVEGDRIKEVADRPISSATARSIDCAGRTLMPGLIDAHVHAYGVDADLGRLDRLPRSLQ